MKKENRSLDDIANILGDLQEGIIARLEKRELREVLRLQKKEIFLPRDLIPGDVYLQAADGGYSVSVLPNGQTAMYFSTRQQKQ